MHTVKGNLGKRAVQKRKPQRFYSVAPWLRPGGSILELCLCSPTKVTPLATGEAGGSQEEAGAALGDACARPCQQLARPELGRGSQSILMSRWNTLVLQEAQRYLLLCPLQSFILQGLYFGFLHTDKELAAS